MAAGTGTGLIQCEVSSCWRVKPQGCHPGRSARRAGKPSGVHSPQKCAPSSMHGTDMRRLPPGVGAFFVRCIPGKDRPLWGDGSLELKVEMLRVFVLARQAIVQGCETKPADTALDLLHGLFLPDENAQCLAVERIAGFQLADGEGRCKGRLSHLTRMRAFSTFERQPPTAKPPFGGNSDTTALSRRGCGS